MDLMVSNDFLYLEIFHPTLCRMIHQFLFLDPMVTAGHRKWAMETPRSFAVSRGSADQKGDLSKPAQSTRRLEDRPFFHRTNMGKPVTKSGTTMNSNWKNHEKKQGKTWDVGGFPHFLCGFFALRS